MCGICGAIWTSERKAVAPDIFDRATDELTHRGPDGRGVVFLPLDADAISPERAGLFDNSDNNDNIGNIGKVDASNGADVGVFSSARSANAFGAWARARARGVAFGHRRLAIVDLSDAGRQPFANDDGSVWLTFNGEIYNYVELRDELTRRGRRFRTRSDVEVLMRAYEEFGVDCLPRLNGMFAFAIWDARRRRCLLARDRIAKKPLYYRVEPERLLFASELNALRRLPNVPDELDLTALRLYFVYQYVPHPRTIYRGVAKLPPASFAIWEEGKDLTVSTYWRPEETANLGATKALNKLNGDKDVEFNGRNGASISGISDLKSGFCSDFDPNASFEETARELRRRLEDATRIRMRCDVPFGAFLSGGIDSTIVVGLMRQFSTEKVRTFSIGFAQKEYDETAFAARTAARFGTEHVEFRVEPDAEAIIPALVRQYGEPFADSSAIPTWYLCELTKREATVALGGDGGDELFCGYDRYKALRLSEIVDKTPRFIRRFLAGPFRSLVPNSTRQRSPFRRARRFLETLGMEKLEQYLQWIAIFNRSRLNSLLNDDYWADCAAQEKNVGFSDINNIGENAGRPSADELDCVDFLRDAYRKFERRDLTSAISFVDLTTYLPCDIMTKVDVASMRSALEVRAPMLDPNVVDLALRLPLKYKLRGKKGKAILREACRDLIPPEIDARPKTGFGVPLDAWFRGPLNKTLKDALLSDSPSRTRYFNRSFVEKLIKEHETRQFDHAARLWALLVFRLWEENRV